MYFAVEWWCSMVRNIHLYFHTSILATFLRYIEYGNYPTMLIYIEKGIVKWYKNSSDFPFKWIPKDFKLPVYTVAGDLYYNNVSDEISQKVDAVEWFSEDFEIHNKKKWKLWEQCYRVSDNGIVSCLWTS